MDVAAYHGAQLAELVARVGEAIDRYRAGELCAPDVDGVLFQYSRAAKELWKFCNLVQVEIAADIIRKEPGYLGQIASYHGLGGGRRRLRAATYEGWDGRTLLAPGRSNVARLPIPATRTPADTVNPGLPRGRCPDHDQ